ncbi:CCR4-NOT transcription complex subunit 1-like isoform X2 [Vespa mandarinia]|uniref:CCR4-NOT transcription complex subunit 1-like isoform X2 n=1 Tax=Vespa mandarinia TaxID=7446 RepID=UPI00161188DD|nr:CCR4-NOT transcription complex subunit 1-like isoform X2 [Vespa mandarinia]XP_046836598.1 CCR4-NOT transcription complex subunit 1 isoform X2 [Vespa crabro]XP_047369073.1 CCR4-NOT transcription complex subunit 1 isoform X2 [Vespa velutina]
MNLDSLSFTLSQISYLVANLTKKNFRDSCKEISILVQWKGLEADRHLLRSLLSYVDFSTGEPPESSAKDYFQVQLLKQECTNLLSKPSLISNFCFAIDHPLHHQKTLNSSPKFFLHLKKVLGLTLVQEVAFAIVLQHSENIDIRALAHEHIKKQLPELIKNYINSETSNKHHEEGLHDSSPEVLHLILSQVFHIPNQFGVSSEAKEKFLKNLRRDFPRELVPVVLAPLLYPGDGETPQAKIELNMAVNQMDGNSLVELIMELGYGFTSSVEECRSALAGLGAREISPACVARVLAHMARSCNSLDDAGGLQSFWGNSASTQDANKEKTSESIAPTTWNVEVFVQALKEIQSTLLWNEVIVKLDHAEFIIKDRQGLNLLIMGLRLGLQHQGYPPDVFPVELFYRHWENVEGQFSLVQQILKCPDIFCFADYPYHSVTVDVLKAAPEGDSKEAQTWRSLYVVELLLHMAERGLYGPVQEIFKWPIQHCPDVLVLALLQINPPITLLRQELLSTLMPIFLGNHPNSAVILHHAWHANNVKIKSIIMHAMAEWYIRGDHDQTRLSRILDVAQDLKALSALLNAQSFPFVIDLACLASRREYLKLEKWLTDKIRDHGEVFVAACVKFLHRRCPQVMGPGIKEDPTVPKASQLPQETLTTILACLQVCAGSVSQECSEAIMTMVQNCSLMLNKTTMSRPPPPGVLRHRGLEPFNPATLGGQLFSSKQVDPLGNLSSSLASMGLGSSLGPPSSSAFNLPGALGPLVSAPGSPSRLTGPSPSPFPMLPLSSQLHSGPVGTQGPSVLPGSTIGGLGRLGPPTGIEKARIPETSNLFPDMPQNVSKEIEDEANSYFQCIYNHPPHPTLSIDEVLDMLKKFQDSGNKREREVFNCMLRNLFEEYRFFPQYPDKELQITAQLFGGIIERGLVNSYMTLGLALRFVLDALRKPDGSKMYYFGITALDRFKSRLKDYQTYCEHVRNIQHFSEFPPHLIEYIEYGLQGQEPPTRPQGPVLPKTLAAMLAPVTTPYKTITTTTITTSTTQAKPSTTPTTSLSARPSIANATNIDTLLVATDKEEKITTPPEALQDKTAFIFNNLSQLNLQQKCDEIREIVTEDYWPWMAQYLVMKRASIELNFHALYSNFLDCLKLPEVNKMVTRETFRNIKVLLRSDKGIANFSDRSLLKNLGHWLGMLTLGRNKPILQVDIDLKSLLVEAYHKGQQELLYVVPFVAKVLESCAKSRVFRPPNPWTMAIMNVLAELHQEPDLKLNLKFEIEVLCKNLSIDVGELKPAVYLKDPEKLRNLDYQLSHPNKKTEAGNNQQQTQAPIEELVGPTTTGTIVAQSAPPANTTPSLPTGPPEPRFSYMDISVTGITNISQHITINNQLPLFQTHPHLKQFVRPAVERAIQEWIHPVVDRSIKIALTTSEQIVRKDFALDPEEVRMRTAARHMVRNLTAGMAMITCRDQILASISTNLKQAFLTAMMGTTPQQKELAEQAATVVAADNMELACAFVQKTAVEKAIPEMDKRLLNEIELRKIARQEGRRYCDPLAKYQAERMPEQIRLKVGGITPQQMAVYEEFARNIPGFLPLSERDTQALFVPKPVTETAVVPFATNPAVAVATAQQVAAYAAAVSNDEVGAMLEKLAAEVDVLLSAMGPAAPPPQHVALHSLLESIILTRRSRDAGAAMTLLKKAVEGLLDGPTISSGVTDSEIVLRYRELHLRILKCLQDPRAYGMQWTNKHVTRFLTECREDFRYNFEAVDCLIRSHLISLPQYDLALAQAMDASNAMATAFAMQLVQLYLIDERQTTHVTESDLFHTIEILVRIAHHRAPPEGIPLFRLTSLIESLRANHDPAVLADRAPAGPTAHIHSGILQARDFDDPPGLMEKTEYLLREWVSMHHSPTHARDPTKAFGMFVHQMNIHGILKTDDLITRFFKLSTQMCVDLCYRALAETNAVPSVVRAKCFHSLDAFVRLVALLVKHSGDTTNTHTKINLLNKVLGIVAGVLLQDHEMRGTDFQQLPYHRIFIMLFLELCAPEPVLEAVNYQVLTAFCHTLHILRPAKASGFCYAWLELVSHRVFIGRMLAITPQQKCWGMYAQLLIDLFKYLAPYLRNAELAKPVTLLYKGTLRVLLVLLHDFPEFLCDYHYGFCDVIPPNCIQMRNLILSAFPRNMRLPDPFTPNLKVDMLQEIAHAPRVLTNFASMIQPLSFKKELDSYLKARAPVTFLSELRSNLQVSQEAGVRYNIQLMNALVLYVGTQAIAFIRSKGHTPNMSTIAHSAHMDIFQNLAVDLDTEGRYLFLNAIANQLRYPNSHTHYFSCTLLYLFAEANTEAIQEQITRVLLERLIVNRPHPWGLLITFIELIKNPTYKFWTHEFVHCAPEIEKLFESVARSCMVQKQVQPTPEPEIPE